MSDLPIGQAVKRAVVFLKRIHEDIRALVGTADSLLQERGWQAARANRISSELGNSLERLWVLQTLTRIYVPRTTGGFGQTQTAIALSIEFAPADLEEAMVLCVGARFTEPVSPTEIWDKWVDSSRVIAFLAMAPGPQDLVRTLLEDGFMPNATSARAFLVRLDQLVDAKAVYGEVVQPALALVSSS